MKKVFLCELLIISIQMAAVSERETERDTSGVLCNVCVHKQTLMKD